MTFSKKIPAFLLPVLVAALLGGCVNADGHLRPPDPLGRAIFDLFDPPNRNRGPYNNRDAEYLDGDPGQAAARKTGTPVWVEGSETWTNGRQIWVPGHWAQPARQVNP